MTREVRGICTGNAEMIFSPPAGKITKTYPHKHIDHVRNKACVDDLLDLGVLPCCDVGQSPGRLLLNVGFFVAQQLGEHVQGPGIQHGLSLLICTCHNVAEGTQRRGLKKGRERSIYNL